MQEEKNYNEKLYFFVVVCSFRKQKNREAAHLSRVKKKMKLDQLEHRIQQLTAENTHLKNQVRQSQKFKRQIGDLLGSLAQLQQENVLLKKFNSPTTTMTTMKCEHEPSMTSILPPDPQIAFPFHWAGF